MNSELTAQFLDCFARLPDRIKHQARKSYRLWKKKPSHPSVNFKLVGKKSKVYSVRVAIGWRALGLMDEDTIGLVLDRFPRGIRPVAQRPLIQDGYPCTL